MKKIYILSAFILFAFFACEEVKYEEKGTPVSGLQNVKAQAGSGNIYLSWDTPTAIDLFSVIRIYDGVERIIAGNPLKDTIFNVDVNIEHLITLKLATGEGRISQGITTRITVAGTNPIENLQAARDGNDILVTWHLPATHTATSIELTWETNVVTISANATSYRIPNVRMDTQYTIGVKTKNDTQQSNYVYAVVNSLKFAFISTFESSNDMQDDDEIGAAAWFSSHYPAGEFVSAGNIKNGEINLSAFSVLWIHIDRVGTGDIPAEMTDADVIAKIADYYRGGGNLMLSGHATQYIVDLGRTTRKPGIIGAGSGGTGSDIWTVNPHIGLVYDHFSHPIFDGLSIDNISFTHPSIPLIGQGHREDHNSMWDLNACGYQIPGDGDDVVDAFQKENNAVVLATWGHVTDFCCAGIVEFNPTPTCQGRCIAIGLAAYEWTQNSGTNQYQSNIERLTANVIDYLK
jgi:hypothetical protein